MSNWFGLAGLLLMGWCSLLVRESVTTMSSYFRRTPFPFSLFEGCRHLCHAGQVVQQQGASSFFLFIFIFIFLFIFIFIFIFFLPSSCVEQPSAARLSQYSIVYPLLLSERLSPKARESTVVQWYNGTIAHGRGGEVQSGRT